MVGGNKQLPPKDSSKRALVESHNRILAKTKHSLRQSRRCLYTHLDNADDLIHGLFAKWETSTLDEGLWE